MMTDSRHAKWTLMVILTRRSATPTAQRSARETWNAHPSYRGRRL